MDDGEQAEIGEVWRKQLLKFWRRLGEHHIVAFHYMKVTCKEDGERLFTMVLW